MDGPLLVAIWFASALLVFGVLLVRGGPRFPKWLLATMLLLGPAGLLIFVAWVRGHRIHGSLPPAR